MKTPYMMILFSMKHKVFKLLRFLTLRLSNEIYTLGIVNGNIKFIEDIINENKRQRFVLNHWYISLFKLFHF